MKGKVLIAGAGLGGLTVAACLIKRGFKVQVFEQAPKLGEIGAGIQQSANAVKVLYDLGLRDQLDRVGVKPSEYEFRRFDTGELLHKIPFAQAHERNHGAPYYHLHRADFHQILHDKVRSLDPNCITLNARVTGFSENGRGATLKLADGTTASGDIIIGADGIKSAIRNQIVGETPVKYTGYVAWRVTVPRGKLPKDIMELVGTVWCGPKNHCVVYWLRRGELLNFVGCPEDASWDEESWNQRRPWEELKNAYVGWNPKIQAIIDGAERDQCYRWSLFDRKPIDNWSTERVTLLGDAAHPTLPFIAQGACMAIEDGAVLARALEGAETVPEALELYQRARVYRTARVVTESAEHGTLYHIKDAAQMKKAFADRNIAKERAQWLFNYDPLKVPLEDEDLPL
ncbi:MAG: FAD-dependent monooxygenase [Betaproteobacteria bacterium]|nr:FAD-dependent monooxygenase [Betaproteobacteria bacterium]